MTPKSPEEQAAELYPLLNNPFDFPETAILNSRQEAKREAWLSRQAEVDELKMSLGKYANLHIGQQDEIDELKRQVEEAKKDADAAWMFNQNANALLAAKEKEVEAWKKHAQDYKDLYELSKTK
jgi:hypothetical protein